MESSTNTSANTKIKPEPVSLPAFSYVGIAARIDPNSKTDPAMAKIGGLWQKFYGDEATTKVPHQVTPAKVLGVYSDYESNYKGQYTLTAGCEVSSLDTIPAGMQTGNVPAQKYLKFTAPGEQPASIMKAWADIWSYFSDSSHPQRAYSTDFEVYKAPDLVEIYIAVK
jgi:predicted transcriptional regulator YdeE